MKLHHVGYLVKSINRALLEFQKLGYKAVASTVFDSSRNIFICFVDNCGTLVELIESASTESDIASLTRRIGVGPYHLCYEVTNIDSTTKVLRKQGYITTSPPKEAPALSNKRVSFLYNSQIGLIELLEVNKND